MLPNHRRAIGIAAWGLTRRNIGHTYRQHRHTRLHLNITAQHLHEYQNKKSPHPSSLIKASTTTTTTTSSSSSIMRIPPRPSLDPSSPTIKTRILIISDTHTTVPQTKDDNSADTDDELSKPGALIHCATGFRSPLPEADVVLHCGDLSTRGKPDEIRKTFAMLRGLRAPLKLVIAGNHDLAFDDSHSYHDDSDDDEEDVKPNPKPKYKEALQIAQEAQVDGVRYLTEGTYTFDLANGSRLRIFASQYTPQYGYWAFQYQGGEHTFDMPSDIDIAMTHGPPLGILDRTSRGDRAGCGTLLRSLYRARPKMHCFGHIHEAWGAQLMQWKPEPSEPVISSATVIDRDNSRTLYTLTSPPASIPTNSTVIDMEAHERLLEWSRDRGCYIDLADGENRIKQGEQTLFVNASIMSVRYRPTQMPLVVDMDLPRAEGM
ncbi:Metallo-dependent phosphatase-like protein [Trichoderma austrokoningii]